MNIRHMARSDIPVVAGWLAASPLWQRYELAESQAQANLERGLQQTDILLVADTEFAKGQACGLAWCIPKGAFGRSAYLRLLGVRDDHTGRGIGAILLQQAEQTAARSSHDMFLLVSDFNTSAQRFYQREGYQKVGALPDYVVTGITEFIFWKRL